MYFLLKASIVLVTLSCGQWELANGNKPNIPLGYYAFESASRRHGIPPRVRRPPYLPTDVQCPGTVFKHHIHLSPKDSLCGDLNRGYIPKNPMGQEIQNQPYPFEIIKNRTLHFLAKSLPYLKQDIASIPKVVKLSKGKGGQHPSNELTSNYYHYNVQKRSINETTTGKSVRALPNGNTSETRQKACDPKDGILCQLMQSLNGNNGNGISSTLLNTLTQAAQVVSAAHSAASTAQSLGSIASLVQQFSSGSGSGSGPGSSPPNEQPSKSVVSQVLSALSSLNAPGSGNSGNAATSGNNGYSPLTAILDYLASSGTSPVSSLLPARRKKPLDLEDLAAEVAVTKVPPTPCPSLEEYIAPVYARNYQGVWKYVVQIPHEGYFTQTVQKTSCVKTKCDFMDGACHESPRWVSLLVAEIFYPQTQFPSPVASGSAPTTEFSKFHHLNQPLNQFTSIDDIHGMQQFINKRGSWRSEEMAKEEPEEDKDAIKPRRLMRQVRVQDEAKEKAIEAKKDPRKEEECDGYDKIGCYVVRVYYDWFLVPGSCKCWKKTSPGSLDTLKKIFIGK